MKVCKNTHDDNDIQRVGVRKKLILIAEDDKASSQYLSEILLDEGFDLLFASTGMEALEQCRKHPDIDLVLMDIKMPEMDGERATREIKALYPGLPVIAQTAYAFNEERIAILQSGFDDYIAKPVIKEDLIIRIRKLL
jgi:CheY-like chemotaxis protein